MVRELRWENLRLAPGLQPTEENPVEGRVGVAALPGIVVRWAIGSPSSGELKPASRSVEIVASSAKRFWVGSVLKSPPTIAFFVARSGRDWISRRCSRSCCAASSRCRRLRVSCFARSWTSRPIALLFRCSEYVATRACRPLFRRGQRSSRGAGSRAAAWSIHSSRPPSRGTSRGSPAAAGRCGCPA